MLLRCIVDEQKFVCRRYHIDTVRFPPRLPFLHELVNWLVGWCKLQINTNYQEQSPAQSTNLRLEMRRLRIFICPDWYVGAPIPAKTTKAFLEWNRRTSPIAVISWGPSADSTPNICITNRYSGIEDAMDCIAHLSAANAVEAAFNCTATCWTKSLVVLFLA